MRRVAHSERRRRIGISEGRLDSTLYSLLCTRIREIPTNRFPGQRASPLNGYHDHNFSLLQTSLLFSCAQSMCIVPKKRSSVLNCGCDAPAAVETGGSRKEIRTRHTL